MVAVKESQKQNIREMAEKEIQQLNDHLKKTNQQIQSPEQEKVKIIMQCCTNVIISIL